MDDRGLLPTGVSTGEIDRILLPTGVSTGEVDRILLPTGVSTGEVERSMLPPGIDRGFLPPGVSAIDVDRHVFHTGLLAGRDNEGPLPRSVLNQDYLPPKDYTKGPISPMEPNDSSSLPGDSAYESPEIASTPTTPNVNITISPDESSTLKRSINTPETANYCNNFNSFLVLMFLLSTAPQVNSLIPMPSPHEQAKRAPLCLHVLK